MLNADEMNQFPVWGWIPLIIILVSQSTWLFNDARKRNANQWFWGIWGIIQFPTPLVFYLIFVRKVFQRKKRRDKNQNKNN